MIKSGVSGKEHRSTYRVYTEDTDLMGIVYHANYLCFFERARTDLFRENGLSLTTMAIYDTNFAIHDIHVRYLHPARLDDVLTIDTIVAREKMCSLIFQQAMYNPLGKRLSEATVQVVCVNKNLKPRPLPDEFLY